MITLARPTTVGRLTLRAETAADMMTPNPVSVGQDATVQDAIELLVDRGFSGAPVIEAAGRAVGVVSRTDILIRDREWNGYVPRVSDYYTDLDHPSPGCGRPAEVRPGRADPRPVTDIMTPGVFAVLPDTPAARVVEEMIALRVHRLFVVDRDDTLVGVISVFDILQHLNR